MPKCFYCKEREGLYQFDNGRWCCEDSFHRCPFIMKKKSDSQKEQYKLFTGPIMKRIGPLGVMECHYCGKPSKHYLRMNPHGEHIFCCEDGAMKCPEYHNFMSKVHKKKYKNNPELLEKMSNIMKDVQNRSDIKSKKSDSMIQLHRGDCEPCKEFQQNYYNGQVNRRTDNYETSRKYYKKERIYKDEDIITDIDD